LNTGKTNIWQNGSLGSFSTWKHIYQNFLLFPEGVDKERILGAEACLWGETSNENTLDNNLWVRATALGARLWSETVLETYQLVEEMVSVQMELVKMGGSPSPFVSEFCERSPKICFPPKMKILSE
jgi:hexosaminidase